MTKGGVGSGLIWLATAAAGCGVVVGDDGPREVAFHRLCCRQDDSVALGAHSEFGSTLEHIIQQFDSDFCVHDFGVGTTAPREQEKDWPHVTSDGPRAFNRSYIAPWFYRPAGRASRERSSRGRGSRSSHGGRSRSSSRDRAELSDMKCATVEVFLQNRFPHRCPFSVFTPSYIAEIADHKPEIQIGTGQGKLRGEEIVDYLQDDRHTKKELSRSGEGAELEPSDCKSIISRPMIVSAVRDLNLPSLDAKGVVRFMEYATNSRAPTSNIFLQKNERKGVLTVKKLEKLNVVDAVKRLCKKVALRPADLECLKEVSLQHLTPTSTLEHRFSSFRLPFSRGGSFGRSGTFRHKYRGFLSEDPSSRKTVDLSELMNEEHWNTIVKTIATWSRRPNESRICSYWEKARLMDFVLMRAFLAVSGTAYAKLHDGAMQGRLMSRKHWMLVVCAPSIFVNDQIPPESPFLDKYFRFKSDGLTRVTFHEVATLADIDSGPRSVDISPCTSLAGERALLNKPKPADGKVDLLIAYFYPGIKGQSVFNSHAERGDPWAFFGSSEDVDLRTLLQDAKQQLEITGQSPSWLLYR